MERTKCKLCTRLTNGLCSNHTDSLSLLHHLAGGKVATVALHADTMLALASEHRTDLYALDWRVLNLLCHLLGNLLTGSHNKTSGSGMYDVMH